MVFIIYNLWGFGYQHISKLMYSVNIQHALQLRLAVFTTRYQAFCANLTKMHLFNRVPEHDCPTFLCYTESFEFPST